MTPPLPQNWENNGVFEYHLVTYHTMWNSQPNTAKQTALKYLHPVQSYGPQTQKRETKLPDGTKSGFPSVKTDP